MAKYEVHDDLKKLIKSAGLTVRDVAAVFDMPPYTLAAKLSGYAPLDSALQERIKTACERQIKKMKDEEKRIHDQVDKTLSRSSIADAKAEIKRKQLDLERASAYLESLEDK